MLDWLVPFAVFLFLAAGYLGGSAVRIESSGGGRELLGLVASLVLFLVVWAIARALLAAVLSPGVAIAVGTVIAGLLLPFTARAGFRVVGARISGSMLGSPDTGAGAH